MLLAGRREFLLGPIGHVADLSLVLAEAVRLIRAIPTFTDPVELLRRRARSFVWFRLNWKRSRDVTLEEEVEEALKAEVGAAR